MGKTGQRVRTGLADSDDSEPQSNCSSATKVVRALDCGFTLSTSKQRSAHSTDLGICDVISGRQIGSETDLKKVFWLSTRRAVNSSGKADQGAIAEADEPNSPADAGEPARKVDLACQ